jgi:hypothetical protein
LNPAHSARSRAPEAFVDGPSEHVVEFQEFLTAG